MANYAKLYVQIILKEVRRAFTYRSNLYSGVLYAALSLAMRYALWRALFQTGNAGGSTFQETMTFFIVTGAVIRAGRGGVAQVIGTDIRTGDIAQRLCKPYSYQFILIAMRHAHSLQRLVTTGLPMILIGYFVIGILAPASLAALALFVLSVILGDFIFALVELCISYSAFYLTDFWYLDWFCSALFDLFGGLTLPMWFYPGWLLRVSDVLPFKYAMYQPMMIYLGRVPVSGAVRVIGMQCAWIGLLLLLERLIWSRAQRRVVVQGG